MNPPRVSTIIWGVLLLLLAGTAFAITALDVDLFSRLNAAYVAVGLGVLLVGAAIIGAVARAVKPAPPVRVEPVETPVQAPVEKPVKKAPTSSARKKDQPVD